MLANPSEQPELAHVEPLAAGVEEDNRASIACALAAGWEPGGPSAEFENVIDRVWRRPR